MRLILPALSFLVQQKPIIVKIIEPPHDPTGIAGVLVGALGLTGVLVLIALIFGALLAAVLFFARSRRPLG